MKKNNSDIFRVLSVAPTIIQIVLPPLSRYHSKVEILVLRFEGMRG